MDNRDKSYYFNLYKNEILVFINCFNCLEIPFDITLNIIKFFFDFQFQYINLDKISINDDINFYINNNGELYGQENGQINNRYEDYNLNYFLNKNSYKHYFIQNIYEVYVLSICVDLFHCLILTNRGLFGISFTGSRLGLGTIKHIYNHKYKSNKIYELSIQNVLLFSLGENFSLILTKEGLFGTGRNVYGQLGLLDKPTINDFKKIDYIHNIYSICCGINYSLIISEDGLFATGKINGSQNKPIFCKDSFTKIDICQDINIKVYSIRCYKDDIYILTNQGLYGKTEFSNTDYFSKINYDIRNLNSFYCLKNNLILLENNGKLSSYGKNIKFFKEYEIQDILNHLEQEQEFKNKIQSILMIDYCSLIRTTDYNIYKCYMTETDLKFDCKIIKLT